MAKLEGQINVITISDEKIESMKIMKLDPGDTLVVKSKKLLSERECNCLLEGVRKCLPENTKVILLDNNIDLEILKS